MLQNPSQVLLSFLFYFDFYAFILLVEWGLNSGLCTWEAGTILFEEPLLPNQVSLS
jgi:hypothetical protein